MSHLEAWVPRLPRGESVTLLDLGTGSADLPVAAIRWASASGIDLRITALDNHPTTLDLGREYAESELGAEAERIDFVLADAGETVERFGVESFDFVHAGLFLHHLSELRVLTVLSIMRRVAKHGMIWNDLVRSPVGAMAIRLMTVGQPRMVRHDAVVSVEAGFTKRESLSLAMRADWEGPEYDWSLFAHRFTVVSKKIGGGL